MRMQPWDSSEKRLKDADSWGPFNETAESPPGHLTVRLPLIGPLHTHRALGAFILLKVVACLGFPKQEKSV